MIVILIIVIIVMCNKNDDNNANTNTYVRVAKTRGGGILVCLSCVDIAQDKPSNKQNEPQFNSAGTLLNLRCVQDKQRGQQGQAAWLGWSGWLWNLFVYYY